MIILLLVVVLADRPLSPSIPLYLIPSRTFSPVTHYLDANEQVPTQKFLEEEHCPRYCYDKCIIHFRPSSIAYEFFVMLYV